MSELNSKIKDIQFSNAPNGPLPLVELAHGNEIRFEDDFDTFEITAVVPNIDASDASYYPLFYSANVRCFLLEARARYSVRGAGADAACRIERLRTGVPMGSGLSMTDSAFDLSQQANVTQRRVNTITLAGFNINPGDAMALKASGNIAGVEDLVVTVLMAINNKDIPVDQSASTIITGI